MSKRRHLRLVSSNGNAHGRRKAYGPRKIIKISISTLLTTLICIYPVCDLQIEARQNALAYAENILSTMDFGVLAMENFPESQYFLYIFGLFALCALFVEGFFWLIPLFGKLGKNTQLNKSGMRKKIKPTITSIIWATALAALTAFFISSQLYENGVLFANRSNLLERYWFFFAAMTFLLYFSILKYIGWMKACEVCGAHHAIETEGTHTLDSYQKWKNETDSNGQEVNRPYDVRVYLQFYKCRNCGYNYQVKRAKETRA